MILLNWCLKVGQRWLMLSAPCRFRHLWSLPSSGCSKAWESQLPCNSLPDGLLPQTDACRSEPHQVGLGDCPLFPSKETMANYVMDGSLSWNPRMHLTMKWKRELSIGCTRVKSVESERICHTCEKILGTLMHFKLHLSTLPVGTSSGTYRHPYSISLESTWWNLSRLVKPVGLCHLFVWSRLCVVRYIFQVSCIQFSSCDLLGWGNSGVLPQYGHTWLHHLNWFGLTLHDTAQLHRFEFLFWSRFLVPQDCSPRTFIIFHQGATLNLMGDVFWMCVQQRRFRKSIEHRDEGCGWVDESFKW